MSEINKYSKTVTQDPTQPAAQAMLHAAGLSKDDFKKHNIKMGRDAFFTFLRNHQLLVKKTKRFHITTDSKHGFYKSPNRLKDLTPTHAEQVWVSDITYVKIQQNHAYLALVTDAYSKKIMGYKIDTNMKATGEAPKSDYLIKYLKSKVQEQE